VVKGLRLNEVDGKSPEKVSSEKDAEGGAFRVWVAIIAAKGVGEQDEEEYLVQLSRMARDTVAEVYSPGKGGGRSERLVGKASKEATDTADGDADAEGDGE